MAKKRLTHRGKRYSFNFPKQFYRINVSHARYKVQNTLDFSISICLFCQKLFRNQFNQFLWYFDSFCR